MQRTSQAVYEDGLLRPLEALNLRNRQHVQVTIAEVLAPGDAAGCFEPDEWEASRGDNISLNDAFATTLPSNYANHPNARPHHG